MNDENIDIKLFENDFFKDKFDTRVEKHLKSYNRRIESLEKEIKSWRETVVNQLFTNQALSVINNTLYRLELLLVKLDGKMELCEYWNGCCDLFEDHRDECEGIDKKCSKYKRKMEKKVGWNIYGELYVEQLNELKESLKSNMKQAWRFDSRLLTDICNNREVLREFFKKMLHYSQIANFPNDQAHTNLQYFYKQQLAKLDVGSARQTECNHKWTKCFDEDGKYFAQFCWKCGEVKYKTEKKELSEESYNYNPRCACWLLQRCDWWNPTEEMLAKGVINVLGKNPCIKCYMFKKGSGGEKVRSAAHTEYECISCGKPMKKGDICPICKPPDSIPYDSNWDALKECNGILDSKPPEPKFNCFDCGKEFKSYYDGDGIQTGFCPKCSLRHSTTGEPREDDRLCSNCGKLNDMCGVFLRSINLCDQCINVIMEIVTDKVLVKREKIDFWRKELLNKTDEVLKSMKEVLGVE